MKPRISIVEHAVAVLCSHAWYSVLASTQDIPIWLILSFWDIKDQLKQYIVYAHGPKLSNETGMALHACLISEVKNSTKKKNDHVDICFLINYKFLSKIPFKVISFLFL